APTGATTVGFRPEDARIVTAQSDGELALDAMVEAVEPVGAESFLYCGTGGDRVVLRVPGRAAAQPGDRLLMAAEAAKL
ncbi:TOBE domain-containing protein, partial [Rhizobiaceae sp. 2RAB30]